jgi:hypothetical protein
LEWDSPLLSTDMLGQFLKAGHDNFHKHYLQFIIQKYAPKDGTSFGMYHIPVENH